MTALEAVLSLESQVLATCGSALSSEVWLHQTDGAVLFAEIAARGIALRGASLMSDPAPCIELASGYRIFSRIMSKRTRARLTALFRLRSAGVEYVYNIDRSYRIYGSRQPRAGWLHTSRFALRFRCTTHTDCLRSPEPRVRV